jgi:glycolate oxidase
MSMEALAKELAALAGAENVYTHEADLHAYSYDAAVLKEVRPGVVVRPTRGEDLGRVVALCNREGLPLTVRGAGTNLSGGTVPEAGGVVALTSGLNRIQEINPADLYAVVEPGVVTAALAKAAVGRGLFYPPDPGSQAVSTLGGNVAENSGGLRGLKYGVTRDYVLGLEFWGVDGGLVKTGAKTVKCATGYNLAALMVGSEGTLGVINRITLKLIPPPRASRAMVAVYHSLEGASQSVAAIIAAHIIPVTLEFLDSFTIRTVEEYAGVGLPTDAAALLLIEVDGHPAQVEEEARQVEAICRQQGAAQVQVAADAAQRDRIWEARRAAIPALARLRPTTWLEDATVPRSRIPELVAAISDISRRYRLTIGTFGHAGDGNLHPTILLDKRDAGEMARLEEARGELFAKAVELGGTLSGEHGLGLVKTGHLVEEVGRATIVWSRRLKAALDPKGILNPHKAIGD